MREGVVLSACATALALVVVSGVVVGGCVGVVGCWLLLCVVVCYLCVGWLVAVVCGA